MGRGLQFLLRQTGRVIFFFIVKWRGFYWNLPFNRNKIFTVKIFPGYDIRYAGKGDIAEIIYKLEVLVNAKKSFEYSTFQLFSDIIKPGDVIIDVGANSGLFSIFYSKLVGDKGKVHAFEPDPETFSLLLENLKLNDCVNVQPYNFALSNKESRIEMVSFNTENLNLKSGDSFKYIKEIASNDVKGGSGAMNAYRLDDLEQLKSAARIDFIKIDVEGAELLVLQGSVNTILKYKPTIVFELSGDWAARFNYKPYQVLVLLSELGYEMDEYDFQQWIAKPVK